MLERNRSRYFLLNVCVPSIGKVPELIYRAQAEYEATLTILALVRWRMEKGAYPRTLDELVAGGYLTHVPNDPYGDGPLLYRPGADQFTLYSVAGDFEDDGGLRGGGDDGGGTLDKVFWPLSGPSPASGPSN